jgi:hypothetical protein
VTRRASRAPLGVALSAALLAACSATVGGGAVRQPSTRLQQVLPTADQVAEAVGNPLDPTGPEVTGSIALLPNGIRDAHDATPIDCLGAATPLMRVVYQQGDVRDVALRDFSAVGAGRTVSGAHTGVVRFASEADAARMFATFMTRWKACDNVAVNVHITPTSALQWTVTDVRQAGGILSAVVLSGAGGDQPAFPTEHAVGLSGDCIVDVDVAVTDALPARRVPTTRAVDLVAMILENIRRTR